jgi:hypothetical protein
MNLGHRYKKIQSFNATLPLMSAQGANTSTTATASNANQGTAAAGLSLNCQSIASTIGGIVIPNPSKICDALIPRQAPTIIGPGNMNMNKFSTIIP